MRLIRDNKNKKIDLIILKSLSKETTDKEEIKLQKWISESEDIRKRYCIIERIWEKSDISDRTIDVEKALRKVHAKIKASEQSTISVFPASKRLNYSRFIAAGIAAILVLGVILFYPRTDTMLTFTAQNDNESIELPDGSVIFLKKDATISYAANFPKKGRTATFEGEAYFDIVSDKDNPFLIIGRNVGVEVLGTSFNLKMEEGAENYILNLISGKVKFFSYIDDISNQQEQIFLLPGEKAQFNVETNRVSRSKSQGQNFIAWKTGILEFSDTPLSEVFDSLNEIFDTKIESNDKIKNLRLTARFENESLESILESIETIFGIKLTKS